MDRLTRENIGTNTGKNIPQVNNDLINEENIELTFSLKVLVPRIKKL